jgi:hypothetical protein
LQIFLGNDGVSERSLDEYLQKVSSFQADRDSRTTTNAYVGKTSRMTSHLHVSLKNRLMDLRKATNHPYLIEYPLTEDGVFYDSNQDMIDIYLKVRLLLKLVVSVLASFN